MILALETSSLLGKLSSPYSSPYGKNVPTGTAATLSHNTTNAISATALFTLMITAMLSCLVRQRQLFAGDTARRDAEGDGGAVDAEGVTTRAGCCLTTKKAPVAAARPTPASCINSAASIQPAPTPALAVKIAGGVASDGGGRAPAVGVQPGR